MEVKYPDFGTAVDAAIVELGYTNSQVADLMLLHGAGVKPEMVRRYRNGFQLPDDLRLKALAAALQRDVAALRFPEQAKKNLANRASDITGLRYPVRTFVQRVIQADRDGDLPDELIDAMEKILVLTLSLKQALHRADSDLELEHAKRLSG